MKGHYACIIHTKATVYNVMKQSKYYTIKYIHASTVKDAEQHKGTQDNGHTED